VDVHEAITARVSVKEFSDRPVPRDRIERLLELAIRAPNHRMTQPLEFRVLGPAARRAYAEALARRKAAGVDDPEAARAVVDRVVGRTTAVPSMIGVVIAQSNDPEIREEDYATAFMAIQNLCLAALEMGLGTHIKTGAVMGEPSVRNALRVGPDRRLVSIVFLGEPAEVPSAKARDPAASRTDWLD